MATLSPAARAAIRAAGFTPSQWAIMWGYADGRWGGDQCGCDDDRCANGFHHMGTNDCGCLEKMINDAVAWRTAARYPNTVELAAPYGLYRYVTVSTPGALATVSATEGGPRFNGPDAPAESVIRIEARDGWTATVGKENGQMVIRITRALLGEEKPSG